MIARFTSISLPLFTALLLSACSQPDRQQLTITGSSTIAPVASELARIFEQMNPDVRIDVQTGGSSRGLADARNGLADIGMVSKAVKETDVVATLLARDGLAVIAHKSNPVAALSSTQIVQIYRGELEQWPGSNLPISVVHKADGRSTQEVFLKHFKLQPREIKASVIVGDNEQGIKTVAGTPGAIGYVSIGAAQYSSDNDVPIKLLPLGGVTATVENVQNGSYPLARELNWVTRDMPTGLAAEFIEFATTNTGSEIIRGLYFVPVN